jgi:hypothetical protein
MTRAEQIAAALKLMKAWTKYPTSPPDKPSRDAEMARQEQVEAALKLIDPPPDRRDQCRGHIEYMLGEASDDLKRARAGAKEWKAYHLALRRLLVTHDRLEATGWGGWIERAAIERAIDATTPEQYRRERARSEAYADFAGSEQACAVALAHDLLTQWWNNDDLITTTRKGPWWRLSAILYGDPDADLYRYLRAFLNTQRTKISQQVF